jgi:quercetin dioxygenase-like cupin family protein
MSNATPTDDAVASLSRSTLLHLPDGLELRFLWVSDDYWEHRGGHPELANGRIMSVFDYTETWTWWERHPDGDEFVHVIAGNVDFLLEDGQHHRTVHLAAGDGTIVPRGAWHRAVCRQPSTMLFVTPNPQRTEHRDVT